MKPYLFFTVVGVLAVISITLSCNKDEYEKVNQLYSSLKEEHTLTLNLPLGMEKKNWPKHTIGAGMNLPESAFRKVAQANIFSDTGYFTTQEPHGVKVWMWGTIPTDDGGAALTSTTFVPVMSPHPWLYIQETFLNSSTNVMTYKYVNGSAWSMFALILMVSAVTAFGFAALGGFFILFRRRLEERKRRNPPADPYYA